MKKLSLIVALGLGLAGASAYAYEPQSNYERVAYSYDSRHGLERDLQHLDRMLSHVRWEMRQYRYRVDWRIRREVDDISRDVNRVNGRVRSGEYNRYRIRREVERLHDRLHALEERLRVRPREYYRWG